MSEFQMIEICNQASALDSKCQHSNEPTATHLTEVNIKVQPDDNEKHGSISKYPLLPRWVKPHMVYPKDSVARKGFLGSGQYGIVHKGVFCQGQAV